MDERRRRRRGTDIQRTSLSLNGNDKNKNSRAENGKRRLSKAEKSSRVIPFDNKRNNSSRRADSRQRHTSAAIGTERIAARIAGFIFIAIIIYLCIMGYNLLTRDVTAYDTLAYGSIDTAKTAKGIIIRNEKVYRAGASGTVRYNIADGEKIKLGTLICSIKNEAVTNDMESNLEDIDKSIFEMQKSRNDISIFAEDVAKINTQIKEIIEENAYTFSICDMKNYYTVKNIVESKISSRNKMILSENKGSLKELANQRTEQENEINANTKMLYADEGGIILYSTDGLEEVLTVENMMSLTKDQTLMQERATPLKTTVTQEDSVFKIVNNNTWYISSYIPTEYISDWEEGDMRKIYIKNSNSTELFEAYVERLIKKDDKDTYVILKMTKDILKYIDRRGIEFELNKTEKGFKVPNSAIVEKTLIHIPVKYVNDGTVLRQRGNEINEIKVTELSNEELSKRDYVYTQAAVSSISVGDTLLNHDNKGDKIIISDKEVSNQKGIYVMNSGIAEFKTINTKNSISNSTHTILDKKTNFDIKIYDRIVSDAKSVDKDDFLYK